MGQLTPAGYVPERLDAILLKLEQGFKAIYGNDINLDPDSPDGQMIGLIAQIKADLEELGVQIYAALDPDHAQGAWLEQRAAYAGLTRRGARYSYLRGVRLRGRPGTRVPAGAVVEDESRIRWQMVVAVEIGADGQGRADFRSVELGRFDVQAGSALGFVTHVLGWEGVEVIHPAEPGAEEEADSVLRARFYRSRARPAQSSVEGIEAAVGELPDVRQVVCLENWTDKVDAAGVPAHSINVIVDGGRDEQIAAAILRKKPGGTGMRGAQRIEVVDKRGRQRPILFDRPAPIDCAARLTVRRNATFTAIDTEALKDALAALVFDFGEPVQHSRLYTPVNTVPGFWVETLLIGRRAGELKAANIEVGVREQARFSRNEIEVIVQ